jgi:hypothetical protein
VTLLEISTAVFVIASAGTVSIGAYGALLRGKV